MARVFPRPAMRVDLRDIARRYREVPEGIEVVRILRERLDVRRQLASEGDD